MFNNCLIFGSIGQFAAMGCLKNHVHKKYHRLLLNGLPNLQIIIGKPSENSAVKQTNGSDIKILNGPEMSRDTNESDYSVRDKNIYIYIHISCLILCLLWLLKTSLTNKIHL